MYAGVQLKLFSNTVFFWKYTPKFNIAPEMLPSQKERIVFQLPFFRGDMLNFRV